MTSSDRPAALVQEWMSPVLVRGRPEDSVATVLAQLAEHRISALPIVDQEEKFVGIVTTGDLLRVAVEVRKTLDADFPRHEDCLWAVELVQRKLGSEPVSSLMTEVVAKVRPDETMCDAARTMYGLGLHHLPVLTAEGELAGILSAIDFARLVGDEKFPF